MTTLGDRLWYERKTRRITQTELGKMCGRSRKAVWRWEHNEASPSARELAAIAAELHIDLHWIITGEKYRKRRDKT